MTNVGPEQKENLSFCGPLFVILNAPQANSNRPAHDRTKTSPPLAANPAIYVTAAGANRSDENYAGEVQLAKAVVAKPSLDRGSGCRSGRG